MYGKEPQRSSHRSVLIQPSFLGLRRQPRPRPDALGALERGCQRHDQIAQKQRNHVLGPRKREADAGLLAVERHMVLLRHT